MLRWCVAAGLLLVWLSGCSTGPDAGPSVAIPSASSASTSAIPIAPLLRTDTLHLLDAPHVAGMLPGGGEVFRTAVPSEAGSATGKPAFVSWALPSLALAQVKSTVHLVVDVEGVVTPYGYPIGPVVPNRACFWSVSLHLEDGDPTMPVAQTCGYETATVQTGVRILEFHLDPFDATSLGGGRLLLSFSGAGIYAPGATVEILSGTADADSGITIEGLQLPITTQTLL